MQNVLTHPKRKTKVVFVQLGSPENPTPKAVRKYLRAFLGDPRVVDINPWLWKIKAKKNMKKSIHYLRSHQEK